MSGASLTVRADRIYRAEIAAVVILSLTLAILKFNTFPVGTYTDDAAYVLLARSIAEGQPYGISTESGLVSPTNYPFGWPLILAPVYAATHGSLQAMKTVSLLLTAASTVLVALAWRPLGFRLRGIALIAAALYALSPLAVSQAGMLMSEPAYLFTSLLSLALAGHIAREAPVRPSLPMLLGLALVLAVHIRTVGLTVLVASMIWLALRRRWREIAAVLGWTVLWVAAILAVTSIEWHDALAIGGYAGQFEGTLATQEDPAGTALLSRTVAGVLEYLSTHVRDVLVPYIGGTAARDLLGRIGLGIVPLVVSGIVVFLLLTGYAASVATGRLAPVHLYLLLYLGLTVLWPWQGRRLLYGVLPLLFGLLVEGLRAVSSILLRARISSPDSPCQALTGSLLALVILQLVASVRIDSAANHTLDVTAGTAWLRENAEPDALVLAEQPVSAHLYGARDTRHLPGAPPAWAALRGEERPVYLLLAPALRWSDSGDLAYSAQTRSVLADLAAGGVPAMAVYTEHDARVTVYRLDLSP